ncbi:hypothetical protein BJ878DRAFT_417955 [Calycina marina]|uniref:C2H2-type domain-containing protein n=1 Tax=Calycina marina TaxID=1763456 RepID=A0A9P7Z6R9_9HELO|nr:hypothetical protein BJ878DRAFT_417955 [Calycina marina]
MTMTLDNQQRFGINLGHMPPYSAPQFTDPWVSSRTATAPSQQNHLYAPSHNYQPHNVKPQLQRQPVRMHNTVSMGSYANVPVTSAAPGSSLLPDMYASQELLTMSQDLLNPRPLSSTYASEGTYASAPSPGRSTYSPASAPYETMGYAPAPVRSTYALPQEPSRRPSQTSVPSPSFYNEQAEHQDSLIDMNDSGHPEPTRAYGEAMDASRGMMALSSSQNQDTPRNIYGPHRGRGSGDSYGFPSTHSTSSSVSSSNGYPGYFGGSVDSSISDYSPSNAGSDIESVSSRTLPRPTGLPIGGIPPAPSSMMGQFSSKIASSAQKKHKCKVCDKRFTRPSSLKTHMYSHTGEKPFSCEVENCGRNFSVVSNLRRHRRVHKGEACSEAGSEDHHSDD